MRFLLFLLLVIAGAGLAGLDVQRQLFEPLPLAQATIVEVPKGAGLRGLLGGWHEQGILGRDHAEIAMACLGRMHEQSRRSSRCKRCRNLARDVPALADP